MDFDFKAHLGATTHSVTQLERDGKPMRGVTLQHGYNTTVDDLWDAVTNPERLPRWFLPVTGNLELGGSYALEGNASGTITSCTPPREFDATWEFGGGMSWIEVRVDPDGDGRSRLTLCHICPVDEFWTKYGPGAAGVGWDLGLIGLSIYLADGNVGDLNEETLATSEEGRSFIAAASESWGRAAIAAGEDRKQAELAASNTTAFYTGTEAPPAEA